MDVLYKHYTQEFEQHAHGSYSEDWMAWARNSRRFLRSCIAALWAVLDKYYRPMGDSPVYGAAVMLHPSRRLAHVKKNWPRSWHKQVLDGTRKHWMDHYQGLPVATVTPRLGSQDKRLDEYDMLARELDVVNPVMSDLDE